MKQDTEGMSEPQFDEQAEAEFFERWVERDKYLYALSHIEVLENQIEQLKDQLAEAKGAIKELQNEKPNNY